MCYGSFTRSITLPEPVDADKIEATFDNGILDLRIPKAVKPNPNKLRFVMLPRAELPQSKSTTRPSRDETEGSGKYRRCQQRVSPSEQKSKSKIPYEG